MGVIDNFIDSIASVIHKKKKDDEEEKKKQDAQRQVFQEDEFKPDKRSIPEKAMDFAKDIGDTMVKTGTSGFYVPGSDPSKKPIQNQLVEKFLEESGKLAQKMPDTTIKTTPDESSKYTDRESIGGMGSMDPKTGKYITPKRSGYDKYNAQVGGVQIPLSEMGGKMVPFISSMPGEIIRSYGKTAERLGTDKGKKEIVEGAKALPGQVVEVAKDPSKALDIINNPAIQTGLDVSDFIPGVGILSISGKKAVKETVEKGVREAAEKGIEEKLIREGTEKAATHADDTLRPFMKTSAGATDLPSSVVADNIPSSSVTKTLTPSSKYSPTASVDDVLGSESFTTKYKSTTAEKPFLDTLLSDVSQGREFKTDVKDINTAAEKVTRKLKTNPNYSEDSLGDILRGNIVAKDSTDANNMLQQLTQKVKVESVDDYINNPSQWGYQGMNVNIRTPEGNLAEVQIHTPQSLEIQKRLHPLYEKYRSADTIPVEAYEESKKIARQVMDEFSTKSVASKSVNELPLISGERGLNPGEAATKMWEEDYLPKITKILDDVGDNAAPDVMAAAKEKITALQDEFSGKVDQLQGGLKERKFVTSVREGENFVNPEIKGAVEGEYKPRANKELLATAQKRIDDDPQGALEHILSSNAADDEQVAMGIDMLRRLNNAGDTSRAVDIVESLAPKLTEAGRTVQAASLLGRLTPEGALVYTQRIINKATKKGETAKKVTETTAKEIQDLAKKTAAAPEGSREQIVAAAKLAKRINQEVPTSLGRKLSTIQTIAQLLNPKTTIRNFIGNTGFSGIENIKDVVATPIDMATGLFTGKRYKTLPDPITQAKGYARGFKEGASEALQGIDTSAGAGKFDLAKTSAFATKSEDSAVKKAVYKPIEALERITNLTLKAPDRAAYQAAYDDSLRQMMRVNKIKDVADVTDEMKAIAHADGLYRTFQDDTVASKMFGYIKKGLNVGKDFGAGDLVLKYPKTPGNLLSRGIEYSPLGFFQSAINLGKLVMGKPMAQKNFVESTARALTGSTAMVATGAILYQMGIITGKPDTDSDIKALEKKQGMGDYRLNASALMRFISSGFDKDAAKPQEGDKVISYDWFQPQAVNFAMGADIQANNGVNPKSLVGTLFGAAASASNTLVEQPLVSGVSRLFNYGDLPGGVAETIAGAPSSFSPTLLNQVKQFMDNTTRDPQDPDLAKKSINLVENKLPLINRNNPKSYDVFGDEKQTYADGGNNFLNVFFNPAFTSTIKTTPEGREVMRLFEATGESSHAPRQQSNTIQINGETKELTGEEKQAYQQYIGVKTKEYFAQAMKKDAYKEMSDEEKVKALSNILTDVSMAAKVELFGHKPKQVARRDRVRRIMDMEDPQNEALPLINR